MAFITSLRIKNFFSIKDEVTIDFKASPYNIENNPNRLFEFNGEYYNKIISFYGANASGKTTVLKAITTVSMIIANQDDKVFHASFKNKFATENTGTEIAISFVLKIDNLLQEFVYEVKFISNGFENVGIKNEYLFRIENNTKQTLIDRENKIVQNVDKKILKAVFDNLHVRKSLIEELYKFEDKNIFENIKFFFSNISARSNINIYNTQLGMEVYSYENIATFLDIHSKSSELEIFYLSFFNSIGLDISKIEAKYKEFDTKKKKFIGIDIFHKVNPLEPLKIELESDGTQMLMKILLDIFVAKIMEAVVVLDELDSIIHPMLVPIIINLLIENDIQIIYSTHNIYNMKFLQNDEVFLIEKDKQHVTSIKPVKDMPDVKGYKNLLTLYENGYLGGVPKIEDVLTKIF